MTGDKIQVSTHSHLLWNQVHQHFTVSDQRKSQNNICSNILVGASGRSVTGRQGKLRPQELTAFLSLCLTGK